MIEKYKMNERNVEKNEQEIIGWMSKHSIKKNKKFSIDKQNEIWIEKHYGMATTRKISDHK